MTVDLSFPVVLGAVILREIIMGQNWRNMIIVGMLAVFAFANLIFHIEAAHGSYAAHGLGLRLGGAASVMMISVIGGRIVPMFTRNWFKKTARNLRLTDPIQRFDKTVLLFTFITLALWAVWPDRLITGIALLSLAAMQPARLARWKGQFTMAEPLVFVLHVGYALVPLGALTLGLGLLWPEHLGLAAGQHIWMAGAIGVMTLAAITRASLGHTGRDLYASDGTVLIYAALIVSVLTRLCAGIWPSNASLLYLLSGLFWIMAFGGFAVLYGRHLMRPNAQSDDGWAGLRRGIYCIFLSYAIPTRHQSQNRNHPGIIRWVRHPLLISLALWVGLDVLPNENLAHVVFVGVFLRNIQECTRAPENSLKVH